MFSNGVVLVLCVLTTTLFVNALPRMSTRQLPSAQISSKVFDNVCKNYMDSCVPWESKCCKNMECMNLARGYCLYPLEKCLCQKVSIDFY